MLALRRIEGRDPVAMDQHKLMEIAEGYTAAWNSGSPEAVAKFYAQDDCIVIDRGEPAYAPHTAGG
jgi:hypothetical protein